jgi:hypothetical protein
MKLRGSACLCRPVNVEKGSIAGIRRKMGSDVIRPMLGLATELFQASPALSGGQEVIRIFGIIVRETLSRGLLSMYCVDMGGAAAQREELI